MQADRAARFVKAHSLLQSRTTTQAEDIPLILMNMSCMNANAISQSKTIDARMKQLFYGLESLPTELLFSDCTRLGLCTVDAWIPREIVPESLMASTLSSLVQQVSPSKPEKALNLSSSICYHQRIDRIASGSCYRIRRTQKASNMILKHCRDRITSNLLHPQAYGAL